MTVMTEVEKSKPGKSGLRDWLCRAGGGLKGNIFDMGVVMGGGPEGDE